MTQLQQKITLPAAMAEKLDGLRQRTLKVRIGTAIITAIGVLLAAMAVAMLVDWLATLYDTRWRAVLTISALLLASLTFMAWVVAAWRHTRQVARVAAALDREMPELEERWTTVTEVSTNGHAAEVHPAMFKQVTAEAQQWAPRIETDRVVPLDGLVRALLALTAITAVLGMAVLFDSQRTTVLLKRFWQPHKSISATQLIDVTGETVVGRGESVEVGAYLAGLPVDEASIILEPEQGEQTAITLVPRNENQDYLTHRLRSVKEPLRYRFRAGDGQSPWYEITVADRPQLAQVRMTLTPPAYTRKEPKVINKLPRRVTVLEGSDVDIAFKPKQSLHSLELKLGADRIQQLTPDHEGWYRWQTTLTKNISFQPLLTEKHGLTNLRPPVCEIRCRPDKPPVVKILTPNNQMEVRPDEKIPVTFLASDDVGIYQAELIVYDENHRNNGKPTVLDRIPVDLGDQQGAIKVKASVDLDLSKYKTTDGAELSFSIRVREDRGQGATSHSLANNQQPTQPTNQVAPGSALLKQQLSEEMPQGSIASQSSSPDQPAEDSPSNPSTSEQTAATNRATSDKEETAEVAQTKASASTSSDEVSQNEASTAKETLAAGSSPTVNSQQAAARNSGTNSNSANAATAQTQPTKPAGGQPADKPAVNESLADSDSETQSAPPKEQSAADKLAQQDTAPRPEAEPADQPEPSAQAAGEPSDKSRTTSTDRQSLNAQAPQKNDQESLANQSPQNANSTPAEPSANNANRSSSSTANQQQNTSQNNNANRSNMANQNRSQQNTAQNNSGSRSSRQNSQQSDQQNNDAPGNPMSRRNLDVEQQAQSSNSKRMKIKVDQWAGSYDGQQRQKLEIAIAPRLAELDQALEKAETISRSVLSDVDKSQQWMSKHDRDVQRADEQIEIALKVVEDLEKRTYGSPYAFIGLQLVDISQAHIGPARRDFWKALQLEEAPRVEATRDGWQHTTRARELLKLLTERFERTQAEYKMAESVERIKKMYRIYIENSMALLRPDGEGNRYNRKMVEFDLDEEYLARLQEVLEMRNEMRAELARILAEDPRLLRRFLDAQRSRGVVLRNELDRIIEHQEDLNRETRAWAAAEEEDRPELAAILLGRHIESAQDLAITAAELHDRFETWSPLGQEVEDAEFKATAEILQEIATATQELSADGTNFVAEATRARKRTEASEEEENDASEDAFNVEAAAEQIADDAQQLYDRFTQLEILLRQIGNRPERPDIAYFATNRLFETRRLIEQTSAWIRQLKQQQAGNYHRSAEVAQYRLAMQTDSMTGKLADLEQQLSGLFQRQDGMLPEALAEKARKLLASLDEQVSPNQLAAVYALRRNRMPQATTRQEAALEALKLAGKLYDDMVEESIKELDKMPVQDPIASLLDDPTLDELLRELEQEIPIQQALGIPRRPSNLRIMSDWLRAGGDNSLMTGGGGRMLLNQMRQQQQLRQRQLDKAYKRAVARALKEANAEDLVKDMPKLAREIANWNRLASQLSDDLQQGRDKAPPERYRKAIEQYFRQVSGATDEPN